MNLNYGDGKALQVPEVVWFAEQLDGIEADG